MGGITVCGGSGRVIRERPIDETPEWYTPSDDPVHPSSNAAVTTDTKPTDDGGTVLEQFAKSLHGREIYHLQSDGFQLAPDQQSLTRFQKRVYLVAKAYWTEQEREDAKDDTPTSSTNTSKYL